MRAAVLFCRRSGKVVLRITTCIFLLSYVALLYQSIWNPQSYFIIPFPPQQISTNSSRPYKIILANPFFNEDDLAYIKMLELGEVVDIALFVQNTHSFTGIPSENRSFPNKTLLRPWNSKIHFFEYSQPTSKIDKTKAWSVEDNTREFIRKNLLAMNLQPNDVVLMVDLDEIPAEWAVLQVASRLQAMHERGDFSLIWFDLLYFRYNAKFAPPFGTMWPMAFATTIKAMMDEKCPMTEWRAHIYCGKDRKKLPSIKEAGIHPSSFNDANGVLGKLRSYSHAQDYKEEFTAEKFKSLLREGKDMEQGGKDLIRLHVTDMAAFDGLRPSTRSAFLQFSTKLETAQMA